MNKSLITALCAAILLTCGSLHATAIYDSTPWASAGVDPIAYSGPLYSSFSTVGFAGQLTRVGLILQGVNTSTGSITVDLFEDSGSNSVGAHLANIGSIEDSSFADSELLALVVLTAGETPCNSSAPYLKVSGTSKGYSKKSLKIFTLDLALWNKTWQAG